MRIAIVAMVLAACGDAAADLERVATAVVAAIRPKREPMVTDFEDVSRVLHGAIKPVRNCYQRKLVDQPKLAGKLFIDVSIGIDGNPTEVTWTGFDADVGQCVAAVIRALHFAPRTRSEGIRFPFEFTAGG